LQCFIADEEMFKDHPEGAFAENSLQDYLLAHGKAKARRGDKKKKTSIIVRQESVRKDTPRHNGGNIAAVLRGVHGPQTTKRAGENTAGHFPQKTTLKFGKILGLDFEPP